MVSQEPKTQAQYEAKKDLLDFADTMWSAGKKLSQKKEKIFPKKNKPEYCPMRQRLVAANWDHEQEAA